LISACAFASAVAISLICSLVSTSYSFAFKMPP
jgi:hypothetical protein